jgi:hypothetical protein
MHVRLRKFIGTFIMLGFAVFYALALMVLAQPILNGASKTAEAVFYCIAGLAWVPPMMVIIRWMEGRPLKPGLSQRSAGDRD